MIEACLERAIGLLQADAEVDLADRELAMDKDTLHRLSPLESGPAIATSKTTTSIRDGTCEPSVERLPKKSSTK